jgi:coproporphyrinogen III oxidase
MSTFASTAFRRVAQASRAPYWQARTARLPKQQVRSIGDHGTRPPLPPGSPQPSRVVAPKTRIAVGIVFVGALVYSMVHSTPS